MSLPTVCRNSYKLQKKPRTSSSTIQHPLPVPQPQPNCILSQIVGTPANCPWIGLNRGLTRSLNPFL
ncbi:hypothetical protein LEP1GSC133_2417 [Leptospira borgpetersenii serovar Pomona str. 200901868]|uniref:Uncharacterized protein n=1 Tax=Leptospira borgpetersenii serovar Pomona str. 200901868 TaxID=1192866 RepID=M6WJU8_LEPBO|nr:hypothetical protein LEP1GSC133_2417 [Leptospira borgpetersenii serovar Pomona str. 200901868]